MSTAKQLSGFLLVKVADLHPSPTNPREHLTDIDTLAASIREVGLIQPIVAQRIPGEDGLRIVAGHRRHAAAQALGLDEVPVIVRREMRPDEELLAMLVENGQRADLDYIEEARAMSKLKAQGLTDLQIGQKIGRNQSHVSRRLALLSLPVDEQEQLREGLITLGAATAKARVDSGRIKPTAKGKKSAQHLSIHHDLATRVRARCQRLAHKSKGAASVGGIGCGECWESVIRADEREHLHQLSNSRNRCVLCDVPHGQQPNPLAVD